MIKEPLFSVIVLSSASNLKKGRSVRHCLDSLYRQKQGGFELIVVENSRLKSQKIQNLAVISSVLNEARRSSISARIISIRKDFSPGYARNAGAKKACGKFLVFMDDDTILLTKDALARLSKYCQQRSWGFGAKRFWTFPLNWFEKHSEDLLGENPLVSMQYRKPVPTDRNNNPEIAGFSFIGNFGYCQRELFKVSGGFPSFRDYGFEDDLLMYKLYKLDPDVAVLSDISVVHVNHKLCWRKTNLIPYLKYLSRDNIFWFHPYNIVNGRRDLAIEKKGAHHLDYRVENAYQQYLNSAPADIKQKDKKSLLIWHKKHQLNRIDYCLMLYRLLSAGTIENFVTLSHADFDNLIPFLKSLTDAGLILINKDGSIRKRFIFKTFPNHEIRKTTSRSFQLKQKLNQFPCNALSRKRRYAFIRSRYPFTDYLKFALIGDDDLLAFDIGRLAWIELSVLEKDIDLIREIRKALPSVNAVQTDFCLRQKTSLAVQSFLTDPPYTLNGALLFILRGLEQMDISPGVKEFYVVLNRHMMGRNFDKLCQILADCAIILFETVGNFSQYPLPNEYPEKQRAETFLNLIGINSSILKTSSSSDLFIFRTFKPNLDKLSRQIDFKKIYTHYH